MSNLKGKQETNQSTILHGAEIWSPSTQRESAMFYSLFYVHNGLKLHLDLVVKYPTPYPLPPNVIYVGILVVQQ